MTKKDWARYQRAVSFLEGLTNIHNPYQYEKTHRGRLGFLKRTQELLDLVGNPEKKLRAVHIAGTSGKGSVAKLTQLMLMGDGFKVGLFTSPFASTSVEKIQINDKYISAKEFADLVELLKPTLDKMAISSEYGLPSYFEIFTVMTLIYFHQKKCDYIVMETGLGGRYDATNVLPRPIATAITMIDYDHTELLGKTLTKIAREKMGIIKSGSPFFTTEQRPALVKMLHNECLRLGADFIELSVEGQASHHDTNFALAAAIAKRLGISEKKIEQAEKKFRLPCRFEIVEKRPYVILDGAHNPSKMRATVEDLKNLGGKDLRVVFGLGETKDLGEIAREILPKAKQVYATRYLAAKPALHPKEIVKWAKNHTKTKVALYLDPWQALEAALRDAGPDDVILVTGSFYLAGELRKRWYPEEWIVSSGRSFR